ncbi:hypothetical protein OROMI_008962 [Orobanche minor]
MVGDADLVCWEDGPICRRWRLLFSGDGRVARGKKGCAAGGFLLLMAGSGFSCSGGGDEWLGSWEVRFFLFFPCSGGERVSVRGLFGSGATGDLGGRSGLGFAAIGREVADGGRADLVGEASNNVEGAVKEHTKIAGPSTKCMIEDLDENPPTTQINKPLFLPKGWREILCRCGKCSDIYARSGIGFLVDKEDSIAEYEKMAKQRRSENIQNQEGAEMNFLNNLGHVEKMEMLNAIADIKDGFRSFLESSDPSKAVTSADVKQIFENLTKKRKRME